MSFPANSWLFAAHALGLFYLIANREKLANPRVLRLPAMVFGFAILLLVRLCGRLPGLL